MSAPNPMPLISRGMPAFTNDDYGGAFPASQAVNSSYGSTNYWRCATAPVGNTDSGTLTQAVYIALDLSTVPTNKRGQVLVHWDQSAVTGAYNPQLITNNANNMPTSYTIDVNPGTGGGSPPGSGWVTKVTVSNSAPYHSRQHVLDMTGNNWIRMNVTAITGSAANNNVALNLDIHSAANGASDSWLCTGDSITDRGFMWDDAFGLSAVMPQQIANTLSSYYPCWECAGVGGWTATDAQAVLSTWLGLFPGKFVTLNWGTNDANLGGTYVTNFSSKMTNMVQQVLGAGKTPVIPTIPWNGIGGSNLVTLNTQIASIIAANPGTKAGPDLYAFFNANQNLIDPTDHIHPTDPALGTGQGYNQYRLQWVNWAIKNIYTDAGTPYLQHALMRGRSRIA